MQISVGVSLSLIKASILRAGRLSGCVIGVGLRIGAYVYLNGSDIEAGECEAAW